MPTHLEARLEKDLQEIRELMVLQVNAVADATERAMKSIHDHDNDLAWRIILEDYPINRRMRVIDKLCHRFIAIHLPSAQPLRLLSSIIRANVEIERMGDNTVTIAREAVQLTSPIEGALAREMDLVSGQVLMMLRQSITAFEEISAELAQAPMAMADHLQHNMDAIYTELMANEDKEKIKEILAQFVIFTQLKRIADLAKNLCEHTIFADTGQAKKSKPRNIAFLDSDGALLSPMAVAIAKNNFADKGRYVGVSRDPVASLSVKLTSFLTERSMDALEFKPISIESLSQSKGPSQDVLVCLEGRIGDYQLTVPFHTSVLHWSLDSEDSPEHLYREIALQLGDLITLLHGGED